VASSRTDARDCHCSLLGNTTPALWRVDRPGLRLRARVIVEPDHFYTRFFEASVRQAERGKAQLREALRQTRRLTFTIFTREVPL